MLTVIMILISFVLRECISWYYVNSGVSPCKGTDDKTEQTIDIYISDTIYRRELVIIIGFLSDNSECLVTECVINL